MEIIKTLKEIPNLSLALGFFDGVHLAHQKVIGFATELAKDNNIKSAVVTFKEHPLAKSSKFSYIMEPSVQRYNNIASLGVDYLIELDFEQIKSLQPQDYIESILVKYFSPKFVTTGYNHTFGYNKSGNSKLLNELQNKYKYIYTEIMPYKINNETISSSTIRKYLSEGNLEKAKEMLGKNFCITSEVKLGKRIGATIGIPTANIYYPQKIVRIPRGVYKTFSIIDGVKYDGVTNFGTCPTVSEGIIESLETHFLDFDLNLYNKEITIYFDKKIRDEVKFASIEELQTQIQNDIINNF